ncbi:MAG TPA: hypothetical protein VGH22_22735 [Candidatus Binatia bacterium]|jgi:hypothetical protein
MPSIERDITGDNSLKLGDKTPRVPKPVWPKIDTSELAVTKMAGAQYRFQTSRTKNAAVLIDLSILEWREGGDLNPYERKKAVT